MDKIKIIPKIKKTVQSQKEPFQLDEESTSKGGDETRVWLTLHRTVQVKEYHPIGADVGGATNVREGETMTDAYERLEKSAMQKITNYITTWRNRLQQKTK